MRADMAKVIVERPRLKGGAFHKPKGYHRRLRRYGEDGPPSREGMKIRYGHHKYLNEHLGPLRRYLDSQVGRPWDKVYSEICANIDRSSAVQNHVHQHIDQYVTVRVILIDGVPCSGEGDWNHGKPLHKTRGGLWYVCPRSGLLRRVTPARRKRRHRPKPQALPPIPMGKEAQCRLIDGAWHVVTLKRLPDPYHCWSSPCKAVDVVLNRPIAEITAGQARRHYGAEVYAVAKRRLARRELSQYPIPKRWWV